MSPSISKEYNLLNECKYIRNKDRCINDTNTGYEVLFNRGRYGWIDNSGIDITYADGYFLWGITQAETSYISHPEDFSETFEADYFGEFEVDMLVNIDPSLVLEVPDTLTARIKWKTKADVTWPSDAYKDFTIYPDGVWHRYHVNLLEHYLWVGDCNNFIFYPVVNGFSSIEVIIKKFAFRSDSNYKCKQPACAGNPGYSHPCPYIGTHARAYSSIRKSIVSVDDDNSKLGVSIDGYPPKYIDIDLAHAHDPWSVAQSITMKLNAIGIGGYKFAECMYDPIEQNFSVYTGTKGSSGSVAIYHGGVKDATEELGFFTNASTPVWRSENGIDPVDGYIPNYYKYPATILYRLPSSEVVLLDYDPKNYLIEIGRKDLLSIPSQTVFAEGLIRGLLMVDIFGKCTYEGVIRTLRYRGDITDYGSRLYLLRPVSDSSFRVIDSVSISGQKKAGVYTVVGLTWSVEPGDIIGLYQCAPAVYGPDGLPPEKLYRYSWIEKRLSYLSVGDIVDYIQSDIRFYGYESLPVYGFSSEKMLDIGIEAELRNEYGVSYIAAISEDDNDYVIINLTDMASTSVTVSTDTTAGTPGPATEADYYVDFAGDEQVFWIDFMFGGLVKNVYHMRSSFEQLDNLRAFCWEWYVEPSNRKGHVWGQPVPSIQTNATSIGSSEGWARMLDPAQVVIDDTENKTYDMYLGFNYVTDDGSDYYPGLTKDEQEERIVSSASTRWTVLDQTFGGINTRGMRLYCWKAKDTGINKIDIHAYFPSTNTLLHSLDVYGISGPLVFDTEKYDIVNILGDKYSSSRISRMQTLDYIYPMEFYLEASGIALAPVGTTLSKLDFNVGGLATKIKQIKIIPQKLATRVLGDGEEPLQEITNLSWGMPSDGREWTYGPAKSYKVCNDRGHEAKLILGVADPLSVDQACVFYSKLDSYESLSDPYRGLTATLIEAPDYEFSNNRGVNYRSIVYSILPKTPSSWYSSTTSGTVWQTLISGSPFTDTTLWSEPENPYNSNWHIYNWAKARNISVTSGNLNFAVDSRPLDIEGLEWRNPTYFQDIDKSQYLLIETQIDSELTAYDSVDSFAGIVIFDNQNKSNYFKIDRYTGNNITTSGFTDFYVPHGDYVTFGDGTACVSGTYQTITLDPNRKTNLLFRMSLQQNKIEVGYRLPWNSWTTVSSYDITNWSNQLRMGLFTGAIDRANNATGQTVFSAFNYVAFKRSDIRQTDFFDYECDFEDLVYTREDWTAHNPHSAEVLKTSASGIYILRYISSGAYAFFNSDILTPGMETEWGSPSDQGVISFNMAGYNEYMLASGGYSAGVLLRDTHNHNNYIKFSLTHPTYLEVEQSNGNKETVTISGVTSASGIWFRIHKSSGVFVPAYSLDGIEYTAVSGYRIINWSSNRYPLGVVFSTDLPEIEFRELQIGNSQVGSNRLAAQFETGICLHNTWGRQFEWTDITYTESLEMINFSSTKPTVLYNISFAKATDIELNIEEVKFIPDPYLSKRNGIQCATFEVDQAMEQLFDRSAKLRVEINQTASGTWPSSDASYKGLPQYDSPILMIDMGRTYDIGRSPLAASNAVGRFSRSITGAIQDVEWENSFYNLSGFDRKCLLSSNNQCTSEVLKIKPIMNYYVNDKQTRYYAGECDGRSTTAGPCYKACPLFSIGNARWIALQSSDYLSTAISGGSIWFFAPIEAQPRSSRYKLTDYDPWWVTDFGGLYWIFEENYGNEYALIYHYPGFNIEGSCYFNGNGSAYWRFPSDKDWTYEDQFTVDLKLWKPQNINAINIRVGRDPQCYYEFTITGSLTENWSNHSWYYKDAEMVIRSDEALSEPSYTQHDDEYYMIADMPYMPLPFLNNGYLEVMVSGTGESDIYMKNFKNKRTRFDDGTLFLGIEDSLYIPSIDIVNTGTIELDYYPSEAAINLVNGDPRTFLYNVLTLSNNVASISVVLHPYWGWNVYFNTPQEKLLLGFLPVYSEAKRLLPSTENPGPFHLVLTWSPDKVPGRTDNIVLWVNDGEACSETVSTIGKYFNTSDVKLTLGRGTRVFDVNETQYDPAAYARFSNLKVYKYAVPYPSADIENTAVIPENLIELSFDGMTWSNFVDGTLPLVSSPVVNGECINFYMRNKRPCREIKELHQRFTAYLSVMWEVSQ